MTNIIKASDIQSEISAFAASKIAEGFVITNGYTFSDFPELTLKNPVTGETITQEISFSSDNERYISAVNVLVNDEVIAKFYELPSHHHVYVKDFDEAVRLGDIGFARREARRVSNQVTLPQKAAKIVKTMPGFKSVPVKNIRVTRKNDYNGHVVYTVSNVASRNSATLSVRH